MTQAPSHRGEQVPSPSPEAHGSAPDPNTAPGLAPGPASGRERGLGSGASGRLGAARGALRQRADLVKARRARLEAEGRSRVEAFLDHAPAPVRVAGTLGYRVVRETRDDRVLGLAAEAALFTIISLPALLIVVLGSLGFVADALGPDGAAELDRIVFGLPRTILSPDSYASYQSLAQEVLANGRADVVGIGLLLSVWTGSRAMNRYLATIIVAYDAEVARPGWKRRLLAFGLTLGGLVGAVALLPLLVLGPRMVYLLAPDGVAAAVLSGASWLYWPTLGAIVLAALTTLYHVGAPWKTPWLRDLPGAVLAMGLWMASAAGLRAYLALSSSDDAVYQQLGTPIAFVLWLYVSAISMLLGAELNSEIERMWPTGARRTSQKKPRD